MWTSATSVRRRRVASPSRRCSARTAAASGVPIRSSTPGIARRTAGSRRGSARAAEAGARAASPAATRAVDGLLGEWRLAEPLEDGARERRRPVPRGRADGGSRHLVVFVLDQPAQRVLERQGQPLRQAGRLEARPPPESALLRDHRLEERLRRLEAVFAQAGEHRHHRRADREVGVVAEVREPRRAGPRRRGARGRGAPRSAPRGGGRAAGPRPAAGPPGRPPRSGSRGRAGAPRGPACSSRPRTAGWAAAECAADGHHVEGVQDLLRVHCLEPGGEHLGRLPVEHLRRGPLGVEAVLLQALAQRGHVAAVRPRGQDAATGR